MIHRVKGFGIVNKAEINGFLERSCFFNDTFTLPTKIHTVKGSGIVNKAEVDVFLEFFYIFDGPTDVGNLISGSSVSSKLA